VCRLSRQREAEHWYYVFGENNGGLLLEESFTCFGVALKFCIFGVFTFCVFLGLSALHQKKKKDLLLYLSPDYHDHLTMGTEEIRKKRLTLCFFW